MSDLISRQAAIAAADRADYTGLAVEDVKKVTDEVVKELKKLPSAQPEQRWIPCSERLPKERGFYLVSVGAPYKPVRVYEYKPCEEYENENLWKSCDGSYCFNWFVEAWMPLPEGYQKEGEE